MSKYFTRGLLAAFVVVIVFAFGAFVKTTPAEAQSQTMTLCQTVESIIAAGLISPDKANDARTAAGCPIPVPTICPTIEMFINAGIIAPDKADAARNALGCTGSTPVAESSLDTFAKCVSASGLTMYGADWCSHCKNEKAAFGDSFQYINYIECTTDAQQCTDKGVSGYPTWIDGSGKKYEGEQGLSGLAKITGCTLPGVVPPDNASLKITAPKGDETYYGGYGLYVRWSSANLPFGTTLNIKLNSAAGTPVFTAQTTSEAGYGDEHYYLINVPSGITPGQYTAEVDYGTIKVLSNSFFIANPVTSPLTIQSIFWNKPASDGDTYSDPRVNFGSEDLIPFDDDVTATEWCKAVSGKSYTSGVSYGTGPYDQLRYRFDNPGWTEINGGVYPRSYKCYPSSDDGSFYPSLDLMDPQIEAYTVTQNGAARPVSGQFDTDWCKNSNPDAFGNGPFEFNWGDGTKSCSWFPAVHTYPSVPMQYKQYVRVKNINGRTGFISQRENAVSVPAFPAVLSSTTSNTASQ